MSFDPPTHQKAALALLSDAAALDTPGLMERTEAMLGAVRLAREHGAYPFVGVDPGTQGAVCIVCVSRSNPHAHHLRLGMGFQALTHEQIYHVLRVVLSVVGELGGRAMIELVGPRPHDGARAAFSFGENKAWIDSAALVSGVRHEHVSPQKWQRDMGLIGSGRDGKKALLIERASQMWSAWRFTKGGKRAIADAALMASWCATKWWAMVLPEDDLGW